MTQTHWFDDIAFPALLRGARATYGGAIRAALVDAGFDDVPRNGAFVIGGIARTGAPLGEVVKDLGSSKQAVGQLIDTLVARGYLDRSVDPDDRRRLTVTLTERVRNSLLQTDLCHRESEFFDLQDEARARLVKLYDLDPAQWSAVLMTGSGTGEGHRTSGTRRTTGASWPG